VADPLRGLAREALRTLREAGLDVLMASGDNPTTAAAVGAALGIEVVHAGLLPTAKVDLVHALRARGRRVAVVGDGINDAPALAAADVGLAMGTGTDVALASAGITLVAGDLTGATRAVRLARATLANIRENLIFALVYNAVAVPVAAGLLYPLIGFLPGPELAALAMTLSSLCVTLNALRLGRLRF